MTLIPFFISKDYEGRKDRLKLNRIKKYFCTFSMPLRVVFGELESLLPATKADFLSSFFKGMS